MKNFSVKKIIQILIFEFYDNLENSGFNSPFAFSMQKTFGKC